MNLFLAKEIITLKEENEYITIYNYFTHKVIKINRLLYDQLKYIKREYGDSVINVEDTYIDSFIHSKAFEALEKNTFFFRDKEDYQMLNFANKIRELDYNIKIREVYFHITQRCNFNCTYCYNRENLDSVDDLSFKDICGIIQKLKAIGTKSVILTGGEPLLRKDIIKIVEYIHRNDIKCVLLTNGSLLNHYYEILNYVDHLIVSLDDIREIKNSQQRLNSDKYNIITNLANIPQHYKNKVTVRSVITKGVEDSIDMNKNYIIKELGLNYINIPFLPNSADDIRDIPDYLKLIDSKEEQPYRQSRCGACLKEIAINANGDIYPCQTFIRPEFRIGNIMEEEWFEKIKSSSVTNRFKSMTILDIEGCNECNFKYLCGGGCRALSYNTYKNLSSKLEFMCDYLKEVALIRVNKLNFSEVKI